MAKYQQTTISNQTETTIVTATSGTRHSLQGVFIANTGSTAATVTIKDGTSGTTALKVYCPATDNAGAMFPFVLEQALSNSNWTATASATTTLEITAFYRNDS